VRTALTRGTDVVFCANEVLPVGGDGDFDDLALATAGLAVQRFQR
jgi:hypothetical protein